MDIGILLKLKKSINPTLVYEYKFNGKKETKLGLDWIGHFISVKRQLTNEEGLKLIKYFKFSLQILFRYPSTISSVISGILF